MKGERAWTSRLGALLVVAVAAIGAGCGVGGDEGGTGARAINWYAFNEPGGSYDQAVANCNKQANGRYTINYVKLPNIADQQRELLVRRLAAEDDSIDLASLDVIWTAEFAEAEWILPWEGERREAATEGKLEGPLETVDYQGKVWAIPHTSNTQLLWYRKDRVDAPPDDFTWDEMIDDAVDKGTAVEVQSAQYEGLVVWINAMITSAGGQIVNEQGKVLVNDTAKTAAEIESKLANSAAAPPGMSTANEDAARLGLRVGALRLRGQLPVHLPGRRRGGRGLPEEHRLGALPAQRAGPSRARRRSEASTSPSPRTRTTPTSPSRRPSASPARRTRRSAPSWAACRRPASRSTTTRRYRSRYPFADELRESIDNAGPRPVTPAYSDISLAIQKTYHPPDAVDPDTVVEQLRDRIEKAVDGKIF